MARHCDVCASPSRVEIDACLVQQAQSLSEISQRFGVSKDSLWRHGHVHLGSGLREQQRVMSELAADRLLERLTLLDRVTLTVLKRSLTSGDYATTLKAVREARQTVESFAALALTQDLVEQVQALKALLDAQEQEQLEGQPWHRVVS